MNLSYICYEIKRYTRLLILHFRKIISLLSPNLNFNLNFQLDIQLGIDQRLFFFSLERIAGRSQEIFRPPVPTAIKQFLVIFQRFYGIKPNIYGGDIHVKKINKAFKILPVGLIFGTVAALLAGCSAKVYGLSPEKLPPNFAQNVPFSKTIGVEEFDSAHKITIEDKTPGGQIANLLVKNKIFEKVIYPQSLFKNYL